MKDAEKIKIKRILFTFFFSILSLPFWWNVLNWILLPKEYNSDGPTDFSYGFITFLIIPFLWGISLLGLLIISKRIFKTKNNDV